MKHKNQNENWKTLQKLTEHIILNMKHETEKETPHLLLGCQSNSSKRNIQYPYKPGILNLKCVNFTLPP